MPWENRPFSEAAPSDCASTRKATLLRTATLSRVNTTPQMIGPQRSCLLLLSSLPWHKITDPCQISPPREFPNALGLKITLTYGNSPCTQPTNSLHITTYIRSVLAKVAGTFLERLFFNPKEYQNMNAPRPIVSSFRQIQIFCPIKNNEPLIHEIP